MDLGPKFEPVFWILAILHWMFKLLQMNIIESK